MIWIHPTIASCLHLCRICMSRVTALSVNMDLAWWKDLKMWCHSFRIIIWTLLQRFCLIKVDNESSNKYTYLGNVWLHLSFQYLRQICLNYLTFFICPENIKWASVIFEDFYSDKFGNPQLQAGGQQTFFSFTIGGLKCLNLSLLWMEDPFWD